MYKVVYYMTGGTETSKIFDNMQEATMFMVYKIRSWDVKEFYKLN